jgi:hypothetical protein
VSAGLESHGCTLKSITTINSEYSEAHTWIKEDGNYLEMLVLLVARVFRDKHGQGTIRKENFKTLLRFPIHQQDSDLDPSRGSQ